MYEESKPLVCPQPDVSDTTSLKHQQSLTSNTEKDMESLISIFEDLLQTSKTIKLNISYFKLQKSCIMCILCQVKCVGDDSSIDANTVEKSVISHITGKKHTESVQISSVDFIKYSFDTLPINYAEVQ
jgi:hypothetical protein